MSFENSYLFGMDGIIKYDRKCTELGSIVSFVPPAVSMPGKSMPEKVKSRKTVDSANDLWVAPGRIHQKPPRTYEPVRGSRLNRYLEFADIALGLQQPGARKKKSAKAGDKPGGEKPGSKTVSITSAKRGFGAFRNPR